jgi:hypothetical protein
MTQAPPGNALSTDSQSTRNGLSNRLSADSAPHAPRTAAAAAVLGMCADSSARRGSTCRPSRFGASPRRSAQARCPGSFELLTSCYPLTSFEPLTSFYPLTAFEPLPHPARGAPL